MARKKKASAGKKAIEGKATRLGRIGGNEASDRQPGVRLRGTAFSDYPGGLADGQGRVLDHAEIKKKLPKQLASALQAADPKAYAMSVTEFEKLAEEGQRETADISGIDCDDYAFLMKAVACRHAVMSTREVLPLAVGIAWGDFKDGKRSGYHAANWAIVDLGSRLELKYIDLMYGSYFNSNYCVGNVTLVVM